MNRKVRDRLLWTILAGAALWRLSAPLALRAAVRRGDLTALELERFVTLGVVGLGFLACGALALRTVGTPSAAIFTLYAALAGLHWGGPPGTSTAAWIAYLFLSGFLAQTLFLHFVMIFPEPVGAARRRPVWAALYGAVVLSGLVALAAIAQPESEALTGAFYALHLLVPNLTALLAIAVVITRYLRALPGARRDQGIAFLFWGALLGTLPYLAVVVVQALGRELPGGGNPYNLFFLLIPVGGCAALVRHRSSSPARTSPAGHHSEPASQAAAGS